MHLCTDIVLSGSPWQDFLPQAPLNLSMERPCNSVTIESNYHNVIISRCFFGTYSGVWAAAVSELAVTSSVCACSWAPEPGPRNCRAVGGPSATAAIVLRNTGWTENSTTLKTDDRMTFPDKTSDDNHSTMAKRLTSYTITIADDATPAEQFAASELRTLLGLMVPLRRDKDLPILTPLSANADGWQFAVGYGAARKLGVPSSMLQYSAVGDEGYMVCSFDRPGGICGGGGAGAAGLHVAMAGAANSSRGTLYAVLHYLEQRTVDASGVGYRFFAPDEIRVPNVSTARFLPARGGSPGPIFEYRESNSISHALSLYPDPKARQAWAIRMRYNAIPMSDDFPLPHGAVNAGVYASPPGFVHTSYMYVGGEMWVQTPPKKEFAQNNEWFFP